MTFDAPYCLLFILLLPLYVLFTKKSRISAFAVTLGDWNGHMFSDTSLFAVLSYKLSVFLLYAGFVCVIIAAAGPQIRYPREIYHGDGIPVLFLVDVSPSMAAADMDNNQNRLQTAVDVIKQFAAARPGDAVGLAAVGSSAVLLVPATRDRSVLYTRLDMLNIGELGSGTALGDGIAVCAVHLESAHMTNGAAVLITDGESNDGSVAPHTAAQILAQKGSVLYVIGTGTTGRVPIDYTDSETGKRYTGSLDSSFDESALRNLAVSGGGRYFSAADGEGLRAALQEINRLHAPLPPVYSEPDFEYAGTPFIWAAVICAAFAWILRRLCAGCVL